MSYKISDPQPISFDSINASLLNGTETEVFKPTRNWQHYARPTAIGLVAFLLVGLAGWWWVHNHSKSAEIPRQVQAVKPPPPRIVEPNEAPVAMAIQTQQQAEIQPETAKLPVTDQQAITQASTAKPTVPAATETGNTVEAPKPAVKPITVSPPQKTLVVKPVQATGFGKPEQKTQAKPQQTQAEAMADKLPPITKQAGTPVPAIPVTTSKAMPPLPENIGTSVGGDPSGATKVSKEDAFRNRQILISN